MGKEFNTVIASVEADNLLAGHFPVKRSSGILLQDQVLTRGAVLGKITIGGKLQLLDKDAVDGSENVHSILSRDTDSTGADVSAPLWKTGEVRASALSFAVGTVAADVEDDARALCIFFE